MVPEDIKRAREHEEDLLRLEKFRPLDDTFMRVLFRDNLPLAQVVLRIITGMTDLTLTKEETQKDLVRLVGARGLCLDVLGIDSRQQQYDLEVQRANAGARPERARYHAGALDVENLNAGQEFEELPTTYVIFITENDVFGTGEAIYSIDRINQKTGKLFNDRQHILYVNGSYQGDDEIRKLMHDFRCSNPDDMFFKQMADKTRYLKKDPKGVQTMCQIMEDLRIEAEERSKEQTLLESIKALMENLKLSATQAMEALNIPVKEQEKYASKL